MTNSAFSTVTAGLIIAVMNASDITVDRTIKIAGTVYDRRTKITPAQRIAMRHAYAYGASVYSLAKEYGISYATARAIVDDAYRKAVYAKRKTYAQNTVNNDVHERANYKRGLVANNAITIR